MRSPAPAVPNPAGNRIVRYDWQRFWIPQTGVLDLTDAGFLRDPVDERFGRDGLRTLADLEGYRALVLLGEPGIGKSTNLKLEHERLNALPDDRRPASIYADLKVNSSEEALRRRIFESPALEAWKSGGDRLVLHLDSLDEAMLRIETLASILAEELQALPSNRLSVRIACRTAVWPAVTLGTALVGIWGEAVVGIFELAPLRRCDVVTALAAHGIEPEAFLSDLFGAHAVPFAIKPLTLRMLISIYQRRGRLPSSTESSIAKAVSLSARSRTRAGGSRATRPVERVAAAAPGWPNCRGHYSGRSLRYLDGRGRGLPGRGRRGVQAGWRVGTG